MTVLELYSNVQRVYPLQVLLPSRDTGLDLDPKAQAKQVTSIDVRTSAPASPRCQQC
jgi:mRNA interferase MazF